MQCKQCNKEFIPKCKRQIFCNIKCKDKYHRGITIEKRRANRTIKPRVCIACKKEYIPKAPAQQYCSEKCKKTKKVKNNKRYDTAEQICWTCRHTHANECTWFDTKNPRVPKGATATKTEISYNITACPNYEKEKRKKKWKQKSQTNT